MIEVKGSIWWNQGAGISQETSKKINSILYLLNNLDFFVGTVDAKGRESRDSNETVRVFFTKTTRNFLTRKHLG